MSFSITLTMVLSTTKNTGEIDVIINQRLIRLSYFAGNPLFRRLQCPWVTMTQLQILGALIRWYLIFKHIIRRNYSPTTKDTAAWELLQETSSSVFISVSSWLSLKLLIRLVQFFYRLRMRKWFAGNHTIHVRVSDL